MKILNVNLTETSIARSAMTGKEHYKEAESLLRRANDLFEAYGPDSESQLLVAKAQVHATLALTITASRKDHYGKHPYEVG